jgi:hypothetical protein
LNFSVAQTASACSRVAAKIGGLSKGMIVGEVYVGALLALATSDAVARVYQWYRPLPSTPVAPAAMPHGYADL